MQFQKAILQEEGNNASFVTFHGIKNPKLVARTLAELAEASMALNGRIPGANLATAVGFSKKFWNAHGKIPNHQDFDFTAMHTAHGDLPATYGDAFIHIKGSREDAIFELLLWLNARVHGQIERVEEVRGFHYLDGRDFTGFIDGTANPKGSERAEAALISSEEWQASSYLLAMRFAHNLPKWNSLSEQEQEKIIGRKKVDSAELSDKWESSHIARAETVEAGQELKIVRHSLPCGSAFGEKGLFFLAYAKDASTFSKMLTRMMGKAEDHQRDLLMDYTRALSGAQFFVPSVEIFRKWIESFQ